jgi:hypothetical protein
VTARLLLALWGLAAAAGAADFRVADGRLLIGKPACRAAAASLPLPSHPNVNAATGKWKLQASCGCVAALTADDVAHVLFLFTRGKLLEVPHPKDFEGEDGQSGRWSRIAFERGCRHLTAELTDYDGKVRISARDGRSWRLGTRE